MSELKTGPSDIPGFAFLCVCFESEGHSRQLQQVCVFESFFISKAAQAAIS